jgi:hypothetical protein
MQVSNCFGYPSIFVDADESLIMGDDVAMLSNSPNEPIEQE